MRQSIVIPVHNEAEHLELSVHCFMDELGQRAPIDEFEVLLVENGSRDRTPVICERLASESRGRVRALSISRGSYGEAVKHGILNSEGRLVTVLECDVLSVDFVLRSRSVLESGKVQFIVASKRHPESVDGRPLKRRALTAAFNSILNLATGYPGSDTHGLKSATTALAKELCGKSMTTDEVFQTEIVMIAWRIGNRIGELPIRIEETRPTPVPILKRLPAVAHLVRQIRRSLARFPATTRHRPVRL